VQGIRVKSGALSLGVPTNHTEPLQLIESSFLILVTQKRPSFTGYSMRLQSLFPKSASTKEAQSTIVPIPKRHAYKLYPESGFEARYERVLIFYDVKNACSTGFNLRDGYWGFQLISIRAAIRDFKAGAAPVFHIFSLCTPDILHTYPDTKQ